MKKINKIILTFIIVNLFITPIKLFSQNEDQLIELAKLFRVDVEFAPTDTYLDYITNRTTEPFSNQTAFFNIPTIDSTEIPSETISKILVMAESTLYSAVESKILRYIQDIQNTYQCTVVLEIITSGTASDIKTLILSHITNLDGVVLIGDLPAAWHEVPNDFNKYGYQSWPCDLYYMDVNGVWQDTDLNGIYDIHSGDVSPEIFVGRISTSHMGILTNEITGMENYLDKNHNFWIGNINVNEKYGLAYTDEDWANYSYFNNDIQYLYGVSNYDSYNYYSLQTFGKNDYINNRLNNSRYEFIQLSAHSSHIYHALSDGGIYAEEIFVVPPKAVGYNLFCCSACRWTSVFPSSSHGYLGGAYVYNSSQKAQVVVGSTKTGSMLGFEHFYKPLGNHDSIGIALKKWWQDYVGSSHSENEVFWFYGMSIIGDPMINFSYISSFTPCAVNGSIIYNTETNKFNFCEDGVWVEK